MARGRLANSPREIPLSGWKDILWRVKDQIKADQIGLVAAGIAFYGLLALFPLISALVAIAGLFTDPSFVQAQAEKLSDIVPEQAADIILAQIVEVAGASENALGAAAIAGLLIALYSASKGVDNMIRGLNIAYNEQEKRGFVILKSVVLTMTLGLVIGLVLIVVIAAALPTALSFMNADWIAMIVSWARWPILSLIGVLGITALYRFGPSRSAAKWRWITPGAVLACALWIVSSLGFAWYVENFAAYNETFGALGGVIVLLTWLWLSAYIVLLGAEIDSEMEAQTKRDSTVGAPRPMGERGAVKADTLGQSVE